VPTNYFHVFPDQEHHSREEHEKLLAAVSRRNGPRARAIAEKHVLAAGGSLAEWLRDKTD
jgi:DNA-binding GntR family transcriptional regulator